MLAHDVYEVNDLNKPCILMQAWSKSGPSCSKRRQLNELLRLISLTDLVYSTYNILIFLCWKMWVAFALQKLLTFFQQKNFSIFAVSLYVNFNKALTNIVVSFEQLGRDDNQESYRHLKTLQIYSFWIFNSVQYMYHIWPNYRTVCLGFPKLLGTLICGKVGTYLLRIHYNKKIRKGLIWWWFCNFFLIFFIKAYLVGTHLNCIYKSMHFKWVPTTYAFIKK